MSEASRTTRICAGTRADRSPCTARVMGSGAYCFAHDPTRSAERRAARARGGQNRSTAARTEKLIPALLRPVLDGLLGVFNDLKEGKGDPRRATAAAGVARAIVAVYTSATLEERVAALEASLRAQDTQEDR